MTLIFFFSNYDKHDKIFEKLSFELVMLRHSRAQTRRNKDGNPNILARFDLVSARSVQAQGNCH